MTCREFKHSAEALNLRELLQAQNKDEGILDHALQCESCGSWLGEQRSLAASLGTLQARTANLEAGTDVERAVLQAFRQTRDTAASHAASQPDVASPVSGEERRGNGESRLSLPFAVRMSRWFEIGAYVAVAAAVIVGMFLGIRLLDHRSISQPVQAKAVPAITQPVAQKPMTTAPAGSASVAAVAENKSTTFERHNTAPAAAAQRKTAAEPQPVAMDDSQSDNDAGYTALMLCDPLSCASDSQVVRMELPAQPGQSVQAADVVVGYDGTVRAVRIVN